MKGWLPRMTLLTLAAWLLACGGAAAQTGAPAGAGPVWVLELKDSINPASADYLERGLARAAAEQASLVVIELDTPGGLVQSMRQMVQVILAAPVPVAVYVSPQGARAASAGAFLVLAGHVAAMAPATNLGAAHPIAGGGQEIKGPAGDKAVEDLKALIASLARGHDRPLEAAQLMVSQSRSYEAQEALELKLIDLMASDMASLLGQLEGFVAQTAAGPRQITSRERAIRYHAPDWRQRLISLLASPNLAYLLMMIGLAGLYFEMSHPGSIFPGVVGGISLLLAFFAMSTLPVSLAGLALMGLALVMFMLEIKVASHGLLSLAGAASLVLGSLLLFDSDDDLMRISLLVLLPSLTAFIAFFGGVAWLAGRAQLGQASTGAEGLIGRSATVLDAGHVLVAGERWRASGAQDLEPGAQVVIRDVQGLLLTVEPLART